MFIKLRELLAETSKPPYEPTLFHFTSLDRAHSILSNRRFDLSTGAGTKSDRDERTPDNAFFLSTSRSASGDYAQKNSYHSGVNFELNRDHLASRHKIISKDYWSGWPRKQSEQEDRVIHSDPHIHFPEKSKNLVKAVHVFHDFSKDSNAADDWDKQRVGFSHAHVRRIMIEAKKQGIPVHLYDNKNHFLTTNTDKSVPVSSVNLKGQAPSGRTRVSDYLKRYRELALTKATSFSNTKHNKRLWSTPSASAIEADIHYAVKSGDEFHRKSLYKTLNVMKQANAKNPEAFATHIKNIWDKKRGY